MWPYAVQKDGAGTVQQDLELVKATWGAVGSKQALSIVMGSYAAKQGAARKGAYGALSNSFPLKRELPYIRVCTPPFS